MEEASQQKQINEEWVEVTGRLDRLLAAVSQLTMQLVAAVARGGAVESKVAYLRINEMVLDYLAMEKILMLVQEIGVMLPIMEEEAQASLWVARCLEVHEGMIWQPRVVAWTGDPMSGEASTARSMESANTPTEEDPELGEEETQQRQIAQE
ncbi:unnamed protein product [Lampetra planeri]